MAYVAVKGGKQAIEESLKRLKQKRIYSGHVLDVEDIKYGERLLVDQVMSESSLYSPELAALAIKQGEGSMEEAVFLLRAYRSTLPRKYYSNPVEMADMHVERRISAAFKDIPGGQILGASYDYLHRLLDFDLMDEDKEQLQAIVEKYEEDTMTSGISVPKVSDYLRAEGLIETVEKKDIEPKDATKETLSFPTQRSERLQILTRGMTQAVISLGYASLRGYGSVHPTVGELRVGSVPITIPDPMSDKEEDSYYIGDICVTEVESLVPDYVRNKEGHKELSFKIGYGLTLGQNESKTIAMSILDCCLEEKDKKFAVNDEEFVLYHIDAVEATGFISHLKLPHYVTFQSKLNSTRKVKGQHHEEEI